MKSIQKLIPIAAIVIGAATLGLWALLYSPMVSAGEWQAEVGMGWAQMEMPEDGTYIQRRLRNDSGMHNAAYSLGIAYETPRLRYIAAWDDLGRHWIDTDAYPDARYSPLSENGIINKYCNDPVLFRTHEGISGLRLALATPGTGWYAEGGLFLYRSSLRITVCDGENPCIHREGDKPWNSGWEAALGYTFENDVSVRLRYYDLGGDAGNGFPVMAEHATVLGISKSF